MVDNDINGNTGQASVFFTKAQKAAQAGDFDGAIDAYIEALRINPESVEQGHARLRELSARRHSKKAPKPSAQEAKERLGVGDSPLDRMLNAEYLLAKDPGNMAYGEAMLKAAVAGDYVAAAKWIGDLMFLANNRARKPSFNLYVLLKDSYSSIGKYKRAAAACERACKLKPNDADLADELKELSGKRGAVRPGTAFGRSASGLDQNPAKSNGSGFGGGFESMDPQPKPKNPAEVAMSKAAGMFAKARQVAAANDYDYAINLYLDGLRYMPDALEGGHLPLCELALERQKKGGKKPTMVEKVKRLRGKDPLEQMLNAEYLFAKDPNDLSFAKAMLKAAVDGEYTKTSNWIANYIFQENNAQKKPSFQTYILLRDCYRKLGQFDKALVACQRASNLRPNDGDLADEVTNLTAELTVSRGRYDQEGDFRKAIRDRESQEKLHAQQGVVKTEDYQVKALREAREALAKEPDLPMNIFNLAQALSDMEEEESENEAIKLLEDSYERKSDFSFAQRAGQMKIRQLKRKIKKVKAALEEKGADDKAKTAAVQLEKELAKAELEHYRLCVDNYPTDLAMKYEYGVRLIDNEQFDDAIPLFQEAQKDPRRKTAAMDKIGLCFFEKGWYSDAVDVFTQAINSYELKDDGIAKELRYNLARSYEEQGDKEKSLDIYRKIAQLDFGFKDVRQRVDKLRQPPPAG
jgi:tetratricopeptide (TPR) repeat protein